ncbi:hypothetical protein BHE74_00013139 [Ensete ventricosum]|nr:hypothetical protein BHE74_00013139 [Ensete ventricosum]
MVVFPALSRPSTRIRASRLPKRDENKRVKRMPMDARRIDQIETVGILRRESRSERRNPTPATKGEGLKGSEEGGREDPKVADEVVAVLLFEVDVSHPHHWASRVSLNDPHKGEIWNVILHLPFPWVCHQHQTRHLQI